MFIKNFYTYSRNKNLLICDHAYHNWIEGRMAYLYKQEHFGGQE